MSKLSVEILQKALEKERFSRKEAERILKERSIELQKKNQELIALNQNLSFVIEEQTTEINDIFNNIADSYILFDLYGNLLKMNKHASVLFGYTQEDSINVFDIVFEEDYEHAFKSFSKSNTENLLNSYKGRIYTKSREIKWVQINASFINNKEGFPVFVHGVVRDITKEQEIEKRFRFQKLQLDTIVDNSSLGIVLTQGSNILKTNKAFQQLIGYTEDELKKISVEEISEKSLNSETKDLLEKLNSKEIEDFTIKNQFLTKKGKFVSTRTNISSVKNEHNEILYRVALVENIEEELKKEALLEALNNLMTSILGKTDMYEIASEITRNTIGLLGFEDCVIYLIEGNEKELIQIAAFGDKLCEEDGVRNKITIPVGHGIVGAVAKTGLPEIINDTSKDKRYIVDDKVRFSEIAVPIIANNEIIGVIDSEHSQKYFFNTDHLKTLQTIAGLAATQLKNAVILREKDKAAKEKEILLKNLKKSNNELKDFAHIVSHDLKSPLRSINALLNWMQEDYGHLIDTSE
ncbi:MAG: PAS domain S-box protein [Polaribacter sp.]|nr:PAS domain S-box protein [Polaribacter sp.]MDG1993598.1 PAS domain S-box protein [Polaribacter sp.]